AILLPVNRPTPSSGPMTTGHFPIERITEAIMSKWQKSILAAALGVLLAAPAVGQDADVQKQINAIKGVIPKFAIPMREVGDRFQNMSYAAQGGNWALAAYMSKYMNGAMTPASLTKPDEYKVWKGFYENTFADVNKAIQAKDIKAFDKAYAAVVNDCNG